MKGINSDRSKDAIVGVGIDSKKNQLAILLFQPGTNEVAKEVATAPTNPKFMSADETPTSQKKRQTKWNWLIKRVAKRVSGTNQLKLNQLKG